MLLNLSLAQLFTTWDFFAVCFILFSSEINEDKKGQLFLTNRSNFKKYITIKDILHFQTAFFFSFTALSQITVNLFHCVSIEHPFTLLFVTLIFRSSLCALFKCCKKVCWKK